MWYGHGIGMLSWCMKYPHRPEAHLDEVRLVTVCRFRAALTFDLISLLSVNRSTLFVIVTAAAVDHTQTVPAHLAQLLLLLCCCSFPPQQLHERAHFPPQFSAFSKGFGATATKPTLIDTPSPTIYKREPFPLCNTVCGAGSLSCAVGIKGPIAGRSRPADT